MCYEKVMEKQGNSLGLMSEVILFCFKSIYFEGPSCNTDKGTQTITLGGKAMPPQSCC